MTVAEQFGRNLYALRQWSGHSQEALANAAGLHRTHISHLERAEREPRLATILRLADALGVEAVDLISGVRWYGS